MPVFVQGGILAYLCHLLFSSHIDCKKDFSDCLHQYVCPTAKMYPKPSASFICKCQELNLGQEKNIFLACDENLKNSHKSIMHLAFKVKTSF